MVRKGVKRGVRVGARIQRKMFLLLDGRLHVSNKGQPSRSRVPTCKCTKFEVHSQGLSHRIVADLSILRSAHTGVAVSNYVRSGHHTPRNSVSFRSSNPCRPTGGT